MINENDYPMISVVIPCNNERDRIEACLRGVFAQTTAGSLEIIVIDSGSTDGTLEILAKYPVKVHSIPPNEFNHGDTRNLGVRLAQGRFVVLTVADARPVDDQWIERMQRHFEDPNVAGVCGQQVIPHEPDKNPLQWFRPYSQPVPRKIQFASPAEFQRLPPAEQVGLCGLDNVTAMYRRAVLLDLPFQRLDFGEDFVWAKTALQQGQALVYDHSARVYHYHKETFFSRFRRNYTICYRIYQHFNYVQPVPRLFFNLAYCTYRIWISKRNHCPEKRLFWFAYNVRLFAAEWLANCSFRLIRRLAGQKSLERIHNWLCVQTNAGVAWSFRERT